MTEWTTMYEEYEELVRLLKDKAERFDYDGWVDTAVVMEKAADAIEKLIEVIQNHDFLESLIKPRWIPMTERPPEEELCFYSCYTNKGVVVECLWTNNKYGLGPCGEWGWRLMDVPQHQHITHWMPLPEPPKEDKYVRETN